MRDIKDELEQAWESYFHNMTKSETVQNSFLSKKFKRLANEASNRARYLDGLPKQNPPDKWSNIRALESTGKYGYNTIARDYDGDSLALTVSE